MDLSRMTDEQIKRKQALLLKYLTYRNSMKQALHFRNGYDKCADELIKRGFAANHGGQQK